MGEKLPSACSAATVSPQQMSTFSWGTKRQTSKKKKTWKSVSLFPSLSASANVLFCCLSSGLLYYCHYGNRPRWLMCLSMYTSRWQPVVEWHPIYMWQDCLQFGGKWEPAFVLLIRHLWLICSCCCCFTHTFACWHAKKHLSDLAVLP